MKSIKLHIQLFIWFLKAHNSLIPFIVNHAMNNPDETFTSYLKKQTPISFWIALAYFWSETSEGDKHWRTLNHSWIKMSYLFKFLDEHNALKKFVNNMQTINGIKNIFKWSISYNSYPSISGAFNWMQTKEGTDYWCNLHLEWENRHKTMIEKHYDKQHSYTC